MTNFWPALSPAAIDQLVNQSLAIAEQAESAPSRPTPRALMLRFASLPQDENQRLPRGAVRAHQPRSRPRRLASRRHRRLRLHGLPIVRGGQHSCPNNH